ncbi:Serine/threonine-protein kinase rio1 [Dimargaris verticillata]|uniref:Serine/threonine-protein kinase RIO1 n=1 Tax=Dimargaris verticillata TaxID=2761393 RepID=A0A9W8B0K0_9FUNG|nr:Serine/threonine-protein kinase rio1 [Dimargaris verticillata]
MPNVGPDECLDTVFDPVPQFTDSDDELEWSNDDAIDTWDDWENVTGAITKKYNRMRLQLQMLNPHHAAPATNSALPAVNNPRESLMVATTVGANASSRKQPTHNTALDRPKQAKEDQLSKLASRIHLESNTLAVGSRKAAGTTKVLTDKSDRATSEQVLDPRTRIILFKLLNRNFISEINGCISTGKEANVYHAITDTETHYAIKVYKTSILTFKDRDRYVTGEYRFRHGYSKHNPRKMVKVWAEKEMRNLKRLHTAGIACPEPLLLRMHVLVMGFLGDKKGWAYPRLKDAEFDASRYPALYVQLVKIMRRMYQVCHLVHADLSEYNILYHAKTLYIIDVSQSVEHDHPHAFEFLRMDCTNVNDYFSRKGVHVMNLTRLFAFIVSDTIGTSDEAMDIELEHIQRGMEAKRMQQATLSATMDAIRKPTTASSDQLAQRSDSLTTPRAAAIGSIDSATGPSQPEPEVVETTKIKKKKKKKKKSKSIVYVTTFSKEDREQVDEEVFRHAYLPRTLEEVPDYENDIYKINRGKGAELLYRKVIGLRLEGEDKADNAVAQPVGNTDTGALAKTRGSLPGLTGGSTSPSLGAEETMAPPLLQSTSLPLAADDGKQQQPSAGSEQDVSDGEEEPSDEAASDSDADADGLRLDKAPRGKRFEDRDAKKVSWHVQWTDPWFLIVKLLEAADCA